MDQNKVQRLHYGELDGYRGIAALLIVLLHAYQLPGVRIDRSTTLGASIDLLLWNLDSAVDWFFVLSGFLLFLPFVRAALDQRESPHPGLFLHRRLVRIVPAYYLALLTFWFLDLTTSPNRWLDLLTHLTFTHIWAPAYMFTTVGTAWSLANEFAYYLLLAALGPVLYRLCGRCRTRRGRGYLLVAAVIALIMISLTYQLHFLGRDALMLHSFPEYFQPVTRFSTFGFGMLLAIGALTGKGPAFRGSVPSLFRFLGGILFLVTFFLPTLGNVGIIIFPTVSGLAFVLILCSTILGDRGSQWVRLLSLPFFRFLGAISYGVYLWHEPVVIFLLERHWLIRSGVDAIPANFAVTIILALTCGSASYWLVERPLARILRPTSWWPTGRLFVNRAVTNPEADGTFSVAKRAVTTLAIDSERD